MPLRLIKILPCIRGVVEVSSTQGFTFVIAVILCTSYAALLQPFLCIGSSLLNWEESNHATDYFARPCRFLRMLAKPLVNLIPLTLPLLTNGPTRTVGLVCQDLRLVVPYKFIVLLKEPMVINFANGQPPT